MSAVLLGVLSAGVGWRLWRDRHDRDLLFTHLPAEHLALVYVDVDRLRQASSLAPVVRSRVEPDPDYAAFVKQTGFDYQRDLDAAAACYLADRIYLVARGRFDAVKLRNFAIGQGGSCAAADLGEPCSMPASQPGRRLSFLLAASNLLVLANAPEADAARQVAVEMRPSAEPLAKEVESSEPGALLWATATPASLEQAMNGTAGNSPNIGLASRAFSGAQRVYLLLADQSPNLQITLKAVCSSDAQAAEMRRLLQGLNDMVASLAGGFRGRSDANPWAKVLAGGAIRQERATVRATWMVDRGALESLASR